MKKYIFMAVAGLLALSSCSNDDNEELNVKNTPRQMTFTAGFGSDAAQTRATLDTIPDENKWAVSFDANDQISIISNNNTNTKFTTTAGGKTASFAGYATADSKYYSVYPYTDDLTLSGTTINGIVIPANQWNGNWNTGAGGWDPKAPVAWAETTSTSLQFHNLCAILKIKISGGWYGKVTVSADENLAGKFNYDTSTGTYNITDGINKVTAGDGMNTVRANNNTLYIAIAPGEYHNFTVSADQTTGGSAHKEKTKTTSFTFVKGMIYDLGTFNVLASE